MLESIDLFLIVLVEICLAFTAFFQYFSNHARSSNYSNLVTPDVNTDKAAGQLQGMPENMCSVDKFLTLCMELFDQSRFAFCKAQGLDK